MTDYSETVRKARAAADRLEARGPIIEARFHDWLRIERIAPAPAACPDCDGDGCELCDGTGNARTSGNIDSKEERAASRHLHDWRKAVADLTNAAARLEALDRIAFPAGTRLEPSHMTTAQVEADGWCGSHWRIKEFVAIAKRPTGEPFYKGRCRPCGSWPDGDPPVEVLKTWKRGSSHMVAAS